MVVPTGAIWETALDIGGIAWSLYDLIAEPSLSNVVFLAWDVGATLLPFVPGSYTAKAAKLTAKAASKADDVVDVAKTASSLKNARIKAVKQAWKQEANLVEATGKGTRSWTKVETKQLLTKGKVKGYQGHYINSVKAYPHLAGYTDNIIFLTRSDHLIAHGGNWRNPTTGPFVKRIW